MDLSDPKSIRGPLFNDITICGIAVGDPLRSKMEDGTKTVSFTLGCPSFWKKGGTQRHKDMFVTVRGWDEVAERIYSGVKVGSGVLVQGRLAVYTYRDERTVEHEAHYISARYIQTWADGVERG